MRRVLAVAVALLLAACGEPPIDVAIPERQPQERIADLAEILDTQALAPRLDAAAVAGTDIVVLTYETEQAGCGEAYRAAREFVAAWDAEAAIVAVARPGDFASDSENRVRCVGVQPRDERAVSGALREQIAEELVPPKTADNDWDGAFAAAVDALATR